MGSLLAAGWSAPVAKVLQKWVGDPGLTQHGAKLASEPSNW